MVIVILVTFWLLCGWSSSRFMGIGAYDVMGIVACTIISIVLCYYWFMGIVLCY